MQEPNTPTTSPEESPPQEVKRGRGRPRKPIDPNAVKRPRGRPKKLKEIPQETIVQITSNKNISNAQKLELIKEANKRIKKKLYAEDFELFAKEQIKILPKNSAKGFIPFEFNEAQKIVNREIEKQRKKTGRVRAIILKGRQMGLSTFTTARVFWKSYFNPFNKSVVMAHDSATSDALFSMSRNTISYMSDDFRPEFKKSNAKEIMFEHNDSGYRLYTAGSPEAGRGTTPTIAHLSEVAFWVHDEKILAGLFQGISQAEGTEVILESTANGVGNAFHRLWKDAVEGKNEYVPIFVPWFLMPEYRRKAPRGFEKTDEEVDLAKKYKLDNDQLYWRRLKVAEGGADKFRQEYPCNANEAFIVSGSNVFDMDKLQALIPSAPVATREFNFDSCMFDDSRSGTLEIFKYPKFDEPYVLAADVSLGVGKDYSSCVVMNPKREVCAVYRNNGIDPSKFGDLLFYLGRYYNNGLLGVESNSMGIATLNRLTQMEYQNLYYQTKMANVSKEEGNRIGWRTTSASKPAIIGFLKSAIESEEIWIPSRVMIDELMNYVADDSGKTNAAPGNYDDTVIALAIALELIRTHGDRLTTNKIPFSQKSGSYVPDNSVWL
jgi:hypothetical protein